MPRRTIKEIKKYRNASDKQASYQRAQDEWNLLRSDIVVEAQKKTRAAQEWLQRQHDEHKSDDIPIRPS
ncbi:hypothetical protein JTB14_032916 [Gonioctena quinquepunctata]|nr:hypothetical protein JTB14_032916 [Gonioctena quinquepunctata]